jgi:hypothetical protein
VIVLTIDEATPSVNYAHGHHWSRKLKLRKRWAWLVKAALLNAGVHAPPRLARAKLTIERHGPRSLDADNFRAGTKWLQDSLVSAGIIADDTPAVIGEPTLRQFISKTRKTIVTIEANP